MQGGIEFEEVVRCLCDIGVHVARPGLTKPCHVSTPTLRYLRPVLHAEAMLFGFIPSNDYKTLTYFLTIQPIYFVLSWLAATASLPSKELPGRLHGSKVIYLS